MPISREAVALNAYILSVVKSVFERKIQINGVIGVFILSFFYFI